MFYDLRPMWAAGRVALHGGNPYDEQHLTQALTGAGFGLEGPPGEFPYPPWTMWLFAPLGALPWEAACAFWALGLLAGGMAAWRWRGSLSGGAFMLALLASFPYVKLWMYGQSSFVPLLGLASFLTLKGRGALGAAGVALSLMLVKPQLVVALLVYLGGRALLDRGTRQILAGLGLGLALQAGASWVLAPACWGQWASFITDFTDSRSRVLQTTVPHLMRALTDSSWAYVGCVAAGPCAGILAAWSATATATDSDERRLLMGVLPVSVALAPFAWAHDQVVLLPLYLTATAASYSKWPVATPVLLAAQAVVFWSLFAVDLRTEILLLAWPVGLACWWWIPPRPR